MSQSQGAGRTHGLSWRAGSPKRDAGQDPGPGSGGESQESGEDDSGIPFIGRGVRLDGRGIEGFGRPCGFRLPERGPLALREVGVVCLKCGPFQLDPTLLLPVFPKTPPLYGVIVCSGGRGMLVNTHSP